MKETGPSCLICRVPMHVGYVTSFGVGSQPATWFAGTPPATLRDGLRTLGEEPPEQHRVTSWRCPGCALLLAYAPGGHDAG